MDNNNVVDKPESFEPFKHKPILGNAVNFGLIIGAALIVFTLLIWLLDLFMTFWISSLGTILILGGGLIYSIYHYKHKLNGGYLSIGKGLLTGILVGLVVGLMTSLFSLLLQKVIDPELSQRILEQVEEKYAQFLQDDVAYERFVERMERSQQPLRIILGGILNNLVIAFLVGLIYSAIARKEPDTIH